MAARMRETTLTRAKKMAMAMSTVSSTGASMARANILETDVPMTAEVTWSEWWVVSSEW